MVDCTLYNGPVYSGHPVYYGGSPANCPKFSVALYLLQSWPVYNGHPVYNGYLASSHGWPLYTGFTVVTSLGLSYITSVNIYCLCSSKHNWLPLHCPSVLQETCISTGERKTIVNAYRNYWRLLKMCCQRKPYGGGGVENPWNWFRGYPGASDSARRKYSYLEEVTPNGREKGWEGAGEAWKSQNYKTALVWGYGNKLAETLAVQASPCLCHSSWKDCSVVFLVF